MVKKINSTSCYSRVFDFFKRHARFPSADTVFLTAAAAAGYFSGPGAVLGMTIAYAGHKFKEGPPTSAAVVPPEKPKPSFLISDPSSEEDVPSPPIAAAPLASRVIKRAVSATPLLLLTAPPTAEVPSSATQNQSVQSPQPVSQSPAEPASPSGNSSDKVDPSVPSPIPASAPAALPEPLAISSLKDSNIPTAAYGAAVQSHRGQSVSFAAVDHPLAPKRVHPILSLYSGGKISVRVSDPKGGEGVEELSLADIRKLIEEGRSKKGREDWGEFQHHYIPLLFPNTFPSSVTIDAPYFNLQTDQEALNAFRGNEAMKQELRISLKVMLDFYGLVFDPSSPDKQIIKGPNFEQLRGKWLKNGDHNFSRITRILQSLGDLGLEAEALNLWNCLKDLYETDLQAKAAIGPTSYNQFWLNVVSGIQTRALPALTATRAKPAIGPISKAAPQPLTTPVLAAPVLAAPVLAVPGFKMRPTAASLPIGAPIGIEHAANSCYLAADLWGIILNDPFIEEQLGVAQVSFRNNSPQYFKGHEKYPGLKEQEKQYYQLLELYLPIRRKYLRRDKKYSTKPLNSENEETAFQSLIEEHDRLAEEIERVLPIAREFAIKALFHWLPGFIRRNRERNGSITEKEIGDLRKKIFAIDPTLIDDGLELGQKDANLALLPILDSIFTHSNFQTWIQETRTLECPEAVKPLDPASGMSQAPNGWHLILPIPIDDSGTVKKGSSLKEMIRANFVEDHANEEWDQLQMISYNTAAGQKTFGVRGVNRQWRGEPSPILVIVMRRFNLIGDKILGEIDIPEELPLGPEYYEDGHQARYRLKTAIYHNGPTLAGGHYTAAVESGEHSYYCNDTDKTPVIEIQKNSLLDLSKHSYILKYELVKE